VAGACHPKLHGKLRSGGLQFQVILGEEKKESVRTHLNRKKLGGYVGAHLLSQ
jgi:hypothetical protein